MAAVAILVVTDGQPVGSSEMQPGVLLAYTSTLANTLLGVAFGEGTVIHFWTAALQGVPVSLATL